MFEATAQETCRRCRFSSWATSSAKRRCIKKLQTKEKVFSLVKFPSIARSDDVSALLSREKKRMELKKIEPEWKKSWNSFVFVIYDGSPVGHRLCCQRKWMKENCVFLLLKSSQIQFTKENVKAAEVLDRESIIGFDRLANNVRKSLWTFFLLLLIVARHPTQNGRSSSCSILCLFFCDIIDFLHCVALWMG